MKAEIIPAGSLLTFTSGAYSDYTIMGVFRALKDIDPDARFHAWFEAHPEQKGGYRFDEYAFMASLAKAGLIEDVECREWHLDANWGGEASYSVMKYD